MNIWVCDVIKGRDNNLDLIRFIAAMMVIFSHAFPLSLGVRGGVKIIYQ